MDQEDGALLKYLSVLEVEQPATLQEALRFSIELDDQNCFPNEKDFVYPNSLVIQAALENYCLKNGIHLEYISKYKPITFILDGKTKYTAEAQLIRGRFYSGYTLICTEILEDTET